LLIVSSYLILVFFENESTYLGNTINISGKNRFLGELLYQETINYALTNNNNPPSDTIKIIDNNIQTLSRGGTVLETQSTPPQNIVLMAVPSELSNDVNDLSDNWIQYKLGIMNEIQLVKDKNILNDQDLENKRSQFITSANNLTNDLSNYSKTLVRNLTILQITLLGINIAAHLLLLRIILRLIREDQTKKILLQQVSDKNKKLEFENKFSLLQKDISQAFISDVEDKLHILNEQVNLIREGKEYEKNNRAIRETFQSLFIQIQKLAQLKLELENKVSVYEKLIEQLKSDTL